MRILLFLLLILGGGSLTAQEKFTPADAIDVQSLSQVRLSPDGKYLAGIRESSYRNRFPRDHFRFRDPSYVTPFSGTLLVYPTAGGAPLSPLASSANISNPVWSEDGQRLAFIQVVEDRVKLMVYQPATRSLQEIRLQTTKSIAIGTEPVWGEGGQFIYLSLRATDWLARGMALYTEANDGPITVYNSEEPFLKWDAISNHENLAIPAKVSLRNGVVTELLGEGGYRNLHLDRQGRYLVYEQVVPLKTSYSRREGNRYLWKMIRWNAPQDTVVLYDSKRESRNYVFNEEQDWIAWADSGHVFVRNLLDSVTINLTRDKNRLGPEDTTKVQFTPLRWSPDATRLVANSKYGMWLINRESGVVERILPKDPKDEKAPKYSLLGWPADGRYLYLEYSASDRWERGLSRLDLETKNVADLLKSEQLYGNWQLAKNAPVLCYELSDGDRPGDFYTADLAFSQPTRLTDLNPWIRNKKFTRSELVQYLDADGKTLYGILYYPVDYEPGKQYPLVCEIYEQFFDNGYRPSMNILANQGYFGFRPSVNLEEGRPGVAWIKGVTAGINKLIDRGLVDPKKLGVHGTSYGGYATSLLIAQTDRFAAAINISGKTNIVSFLGDSPKIGTRNYAAAEVGQDRIGASLWDAPMKYLEHSAVLYADRMNTPHLLLTGEGDWNVPAANTRELYYALRRLGKKVVWVNYKNAGHGAGWAGSESDYHDQWKRILDWYQVHFEDKKEKE